MNNSGEASVPRIGVFIDGSFLEKVRDACESDHQKPPSLSHFVESVIAKLPKSRGAEPDRTVGTEVHWFRGKLPEAEGKTRGQDDSRELADRKVKEQRLQSELAEARIITHRRVMCRRDGPCGPDWHEKGIDTWLLAEALDFADNRKPEALVLVGGDGDHVTLLEWMKKRGIDTILVYYDSPSPSVPGCTKTHRWLKEKADKHLMIDWRNGFTLLTPDELEQRDRATKERIIRYAQGHSEARPSPGLPK